MRENFLEMYRQVFPRGIRVDGSMQKPEAPSWVREYIKQRRYNVSLEEGIERTDMELSVLRVELEEWVIAKCMIENQIDKQKLKIIEKEMMLGVLRREKER